MEPFNRDEIEKIPPGVSPVRHIMAENKLDVDFHPLHNFEEAKKDPDGVAVFEGDYGGQIMMTIRMSYVKCAERQLELLLFDLNQVAWKCNDDTGTGIYYERLKIGDGVVGGMGGGRVVDGVWIHSRFEEKYGLDMGKLGPAVGDVLEGRALRVPERLLWTKDA